MKRLQKLATKRSLPMNNTEKDSSEIHVHKKPKSDNPWLEVPSFDAKEKDAMKEKIAQLRKLRRAGKVDHGVMKKLMQDTYPLRRQTILAGTDTVDMIIKSFPVLIQPAHVSFFDIVYRSNVYNSKFKEPFQFNGIVNMQTKVVDRGSWSMVGKAGSYRITGSQYSHCLGRTLLCQLNNFMSCI